MTLPDTTGPELNSLLQARDRYRYHGNGIHDKTLTALIAPTAVGKSTIISEVLRLAATQGIDAAEVGSLTTRPRRHASDPANYRTADEGITREWMLDQIASGTLVNWSASPTGELYGTVAESFPATHNFLPLIPDSLPMMEQAGFRAVHGVYITIPVDQWAVQLGERRHDPAIKGRIEEAISSLQFARQHLDSLHFIHNTTASGQPPRPTVAAQAILDIALNHATNHEDIDARQHLEEMIEYATLVLGEYN